jgi:hypothetical protein
MFTAVLTKEKQGKFGDILPPGMEFSAENFDGLIHVRYSCEDLYFESRQACEAFGLKLHPEGESPLELRRKEFPVELYIGLHDGDGLSKRDIPDLPHTLGMIQYFGNISEKWIKSSDRVIAVLDRGAVVIEFETPRIYWGGTVDSGNVYSQGSGDGFMSPGYD